MQTHLPGITWVKGTSPRIHAFRSAKAWETVTLCGQPVAVMTPLDPQLVDEASLCHRCQRGLQAWGYITRDKPTVRFPYEEIIAPLGIRRADICEALQQQQIAPTPEAIESIARYLRSVAAAWAKATLQDEKDWQSWLAKDRESA